MSRICLKCTLVSVFLILFGCAAPPVGYDEAGRPDGALALQAQEEVKIESVFVTNQPEVESEASVTLECPSAHQLGCRFKGRLYPWNAWVEKAGYSSPRYMIQNVQKIGNRAIVTISFSPALPKGSETEHIQ